MSYYLSGLGADEDLPPDYAANYAAGMDVSTANGSPANAASIADSIAKIANSAFGVADSVQKRLLESKLASQARSGKPLVLPSTTSPWLIVGGIVAAVALVGVVASRK